MLRLQAKHRRRPGGPRHGRDRDEQLGVLAQHVVGRHGVGDRVVLALEQGRAVEPGEEREPEADDEEHRGDRRVAGVPRERERREPRRDRAAAPGPLPRAQHGREQPRADDRGDERDEARQQEQEEAGAAAGGERGRARRAPGDPDHDRDERADRGDVGDRHPDASDPRGGRAQHGGDQQRRHEREAEPDEEPGRRESRVCQHGSDGRAGSPGQRRREPDSDGAAEEGSGDRDDGGLGEGAELELPRRSAEPGEPAPRRLDVPSQARRREQREREQQRDGLAAEQQQAPLRGARGRRGGLQRLDRPVDLEERRAGLDLRARPLDLARQTRDRPRDGRFAGASGSIQA